MYVDGSLTGIPVVVEWAKSTFLFVLHFPNKPLPPQCFKKLNEVVFVGESVNVCICLPAGAARSTGRLRV